MGITSVLIKRTECKVSVMGLKTKKAILAMVIAIMFVAVSSVTAFALLIHETRVDSSVVFGEITPSATDFVLTADKKLSFTTAKEKIAVKMAVKNSSNLPLNYRYEISVTNGNGLENAILVNVKDEFIGVLGKGVLTVEGGMIYPKQGDISDEIIDTVEFELHNGALNSFANNKNCVVNIKLVTETIDYGKNILVTDLGTLKKAIDDVNRGSNTKTLHIIGDILVDSEITVTNAVTFDFTKGKLLFGKNKLVFNGANVAESGIISFISSRGDYSDTMNTGKPLSIRSTKLAVKFDNNCQSIANLVELLYYNESIACDLIADNATTLLNSGIKSGESVDILGSLSIYSDKIRLLRAGSGDIGFSISDGIITTHNISRTINESLIIENSAGSHSVTVNFKVIGTSENEYADILADSFKHLYALTSDKGVELNADIYLPLSVPKYNMSISWSSDKPSVLDNSGAISAEGEGGVILTATISINGDIIVRQFTFAVYKQNNQMRFDYLVARIGEQKLTALYTQDSIIGSGDGSNFVLPIVSAGNEYDYRTMYSMRNIGLDVLTYQLDMNADYLSLFGGNTVALMEPTFDTSTSVTIRGVFKNEPKKIYEATIHVEIEPIDDVKLHNEIVDYVQGLLNNIDILENILSTRATDGMTNERGDFILPSKYKIYTLSYSLSDAVGAEADPIISGISELTNEDGELYYSFAVNAARFDINKKKVKFYINIEMTEKNGSSIPKTSSPVYVESPEAVHFGADNNSLWIDSLSKGDGAVSNSDIFYNLKLQVINALNGENGVPTVGATFDDTLRFAIAPNYILIRDIKLLRSLYIICDGATAYSAGTTAISEINGIPYLGLPKGALTSGSDTLDINAYGILSSAENIDTIRIEAINGGDSLYSVGNAEDFLEYCVNSFKSLSAIIMRNSGLTKASSIQEVENISYIDLSGNKSLDAFDWLSKLKNPKVSYINVSDTLFSTEKAGIFDALYYRCKRADNSFSPIYIYSGMDGAIITHTPVEGDALLLSHLLYSLNDLQSVNMQYLQLKPTLFDGDNSYSVGWSIKDAVNNVISVDGINVATIVPNPTRLENLLVTNDELKVSEFKEISLIATLTKGNVIVAREFKIPVYYYYVKQSN